MEQLPNKKSYSIFLSHKNKELEFQIKNLILNNIKNINLQVFENKELMLQDPNLKEVDLIILSIEFNVELTEDIYNFLTKIHKETGALFLIFTNHISFDENKISFINQEKIVAEFINEITFSNFVFINRVKVLLNNPRILKKSTIELQKIQNGIWNLIAYSNMFVIMLDQDMKIKLVNNHLAKILGYEDQSELVGLDWSQFLKSPDIDVVKHVLNEIIFENNENYKEFTNDIIYGDKKVVTVKWFNTLINNEFNCVFSIGLPLTKAPTIDEDIDNIRLYFRDILERDKTIINAMKEVTMKYSEKILRKPNTNHLDCAEKGLDDAGENQ